jgi:hypothetical protein
VFVDDLVEKGKLSKNQARILHYHLDMMEGTLEKKNYNSYRIYRNILKDHIKGDIQGGAMVEAFRSTTNVVSEKTYSRDL